MEVYQRTGTEEGGETKEKALCGECNKETSKYKCPGCSIRTCSLLCVNSHKQRTNCSGKRSRTHFVPLSNFDHQTLLSDYHMLEDVKRVADSAQRMRIRATKLRPSHPFHLRSLSNAASKRRTQLLFLPHGMHQTLINKSHLHPSKKFISWTIEFRFHSTDLVLLDHGVHEDSILASVIQKHLQPGPWKNKLWDFSNQNLECLRFFIRKYPKGPKSPFKELDVNNTIKQLLANVIILEYPVIHVFLPSHTCNFQILNDSPPVPRSIHSAIDHPQSPKGVTFREEQIEEDGGSPNPRRQTNSSPICQTHSRNRSEKMSNKPVDMAVSTTGASGNSLHLDSEPMETGLFDDVEFEFDQDLLDAYSDLLAQVNPDEFLDFDGEFVEEAQVDENRYLSHSRGLPLPNEELEEGEIAE
ncbi:hypothetical protein ACFE04_003654 [Oxalis oulophora]